MMRLLLHAFTEPKEEKAWGKVPWFMEWSAFSLALAAFGMGFAAGWPARLMESLAGGGGGP